MLLLKHNGYFIITDNNGYFYCLSKSGNPYFSNSLTEAYKWRRKDRAEKYLSICLNNNPDCYVKLIDDNKQRINKHLIEHAETLNKSIEYSDANRWIDSISTATNGFTNIDFLLSQTLEEKTQIEKTITDLRHYIEFGNFNAYQGFRLFRILQNLLRQRRSYKDIIFLLENISEKSNDTDYIYWCAIQLKCRNYKPRVLKNMFNNYT